MPVIRDIKLTLDLKHVLRRQGIGQPQSKLQPKIARVLQELLDTVSNCQLLEPVITYQRLAIADMQPDRVELSGDKFLLGSFIPSTLPTAKELAVVVCTIGSKLEEKAAQFFRQNEPLRGLLLDGIGSAAVDSLSEEACHIITQEASALGYQASSPISPGMPGLAISEQKHLFELVPAEDIGVRLTSAQIMAPIKSISMVIGIGPKMTTWTKAEMCKHCTLRKTCRYKVHAAARL